MKKLITITTFLTALSLPFFAHANKSDQAVETPDGADKCALDRYSAEEAEEIKKKNTESGNSEVKEN